MRHLTILLCAAGILAAQTAPKSVTATVTSFKPESLEIGILPDNGKAMFLKVGPETQVVRVAPGERDLTKAAPILVTDILKDDRLLVTFVEGTREARRLVLVAADDIARRNAAERADWERRGIAGVVTEAGGEEITLELRTSSSVETVKLVVGSKTVVRRYAPDSVKFTDALASSVAEIRKGDQVKARGDRKDGGVVLAQDVVFGTFLTSIGTVKAIDTDKSTIQLENLATREMVTVRVTADSRIRLLPGFNPAQANANTGHGGGANRIEINTPSDLVKMFEQLPPVKLEALKVNGAVILTSTRGSRPGEVSAIMIMANADMLVAMAKTTATEKGISPMAVIGGLHGGMFGGPDGVNLPAMIH